MILILLATRIKGQGKKPVAELGIATIETSDYKTVQCTCIQSMYTLSRGANRAGPHAGAKPPACGSHTEVDHVGEQSWPRGSQCGGIGKPLIWIPSE